VRTRSLARSSAHLLLPTASPLIEGTTSNGYANEQFTWTSYVVSAEQVKLVTVQIFDQVLGGVDSPALTGADVDGTRGQAVGRNRHHREGPRSGGAAESAAPGVASVR
jgi:hypothetical protein